ncbi:MAG: hypothetical protein M2R45_01974 [Verrucomicrobia subdivision 3 bacterium]|nr:hypothetical protein [Limisphaerales bacterium]MCS1416159.1 hypothetical protein [Limisphaerales bacterium]
MQIYCQLENFRIKIDSLVMAVIRWCCFYLALGLVFTGTLLLGQTVSGVVVLAVPDNDGWYALFDRKTFNGRWSTFPRMGNYQWRYFRGTSSHLFSPSTYRNPEFKAEIKLKGNRVCVFERC